MSRESPPEDVMRLYEIDHDSLAAILDFVSSNYASLPLWLSGNKVLQRKLALGVRNVELFNQHKVAKQVRFPLYLLELSRLTSLCILRCGNSILLPDHLPSIHSLSKHLVKLYLSFNGSTRLLFPTVNFLGDTDCEVEEKLINVQIGTSPGKLSPSDLSELGATFPIDSAPYDYYLRTSSSHLCSGDCKVNCKQWRLKDGFPVLEYLSLADESDKLSWSLSMLALLPTSLTVLRRVYNQDEDHFTVLMAALPPNLRHLEVLDVPIEIPDFLKLLADRPLEVLEWSGHDEPLSDPKHIALLPRTLTELVCGDMISAALCPEAVSALPPSLTSIEDLTHRKRSKKPFQLGHLEKLQALKCSDGALLRFSADAIKRLPPSLHSINMVGDLAGIAKSDWPPNLTRLEFIPRLKDFHLHFNALPSTLTSFFVQEGKFAMPLSAIALLPRTLLSMRVVCGSLENIQHIDFPPNLLYLNILLYHEDYGNLHDHWVLHEPMEVRVKGPKSTRKKKLNLNYVDRTEAATSPIKVTACFPFQSIPRSTDRLYINSCIPAFQLVHLPPRLDILWAGEIFEDADFNPGDPRHLERMIELNKFGAIENIDTPASHVSLPATVASLLPRPLRALFIAGGCMWRNCDWRRLPPNLEQIVCSSSELPVSADLFMEAPFSRLKTLELNLVGLTDEIVKMMPQSLTRMNWVGSALSRGPLTEASLPYWPYNLEPRLKFPHKLWEAFHRLKEERESCLENSLIERLPSLFPPLHPSQNNKYV